MLGVVRRRSSLGKAALVHEEERPSASGTNKSDGEQNVAIRALSNLFGEQRRISFTVGTRRSEHRVSKLGDAAEGQQHDNVLEVKRSNSSTMVQAKADAGGRGYVQKSEVLPSRSHPNLSEENLHPVLQL